MKQYVVSEKGLYVSFVEGDVIYPAGKVVEVFEDTDSLFVNGRETDDYASFHIKCGNIVPYAS